MARNEDPEGREIEVLRGLTSFDGMDVLDVGCGTGRTAWRLAREASSVTGIDPDAERIAIARRQRSEAGACTPTFLSQDIVTHEHGDETFDVVVFSRSL